MQRYNINQISTQDFQVPRYGMEWLKKTMTDAISVTKIIGLQSWGLIN